MSREVEERDLEVKVSFAFVCQGPLKAFLKLRKELERKMEESGGKLIFATASSSFLYITKDRRVVSERKRKGRVS